MSTYKKVLFIIHDLYQEDIHFPLGPAYLAAVLEAARAKVEIYDMQAHHYTNDELAEYLDQSEFQLICVGFLSARFDTVQPLLKVIAEHKNNGSWLVLGGHGPSATPEWMLENTPADIVCVGEAEETIVELYNWKTQFSPLFLSEIKGIAYRGWMHGVKITERRKPVQDLDSIPFPAWHLFDMEKYSSALQLWGMEPDDGALTMITSRGCTNRCSFCYRLERGIRVRSVQNVISEMKILRDKYGITGYFLNDELFVASKLRLFEFREALKANDLHIKFSCNIRVDFFDYEIAECLKEIGCVFTNIGFESTSQEVLDLMKKHATVEQNHTAAKICNDVGIPCGLNLLWGMPGDSAESLLNNVDFIKQYTTYDQLRSIRPVSPYMGTPLYDQAIAEGKLDGATDFYKKFTNSDLITVNFMNISDEEAYKLLFAANKELILDYQEHTDMTLEAAYKLMAEFHTLYFEDHNYQFRGARHYKKSEDFNKD